MFVLCLCGFCGVWLFGLVFFAVWVLFLFVCFTNCLTPAFFTQKLWSFSCLSGRALDLRVDLCLVALSILTSLNHGLPVSQRSAAACEEKKQDHGFVREKKTQRVTIKQEYQIEGPQSLSWRSTSKKESNRDSQLDRNTMLEPRRVKREATITAGVLRPRQLRTYARLTPVNRVKRARLRLDRNVTMRGRGGKPGGRLRLRRSCFTGLALCSYTECCGLGGWVGLLGGIAPADLVCVTTVWIFGLLEKQKFDLQFSDGNFSGFGNYSCGKSF